MTDTVYGPVSIKCGDELETIEKGHLQSQNCTGEVDDVEDYRSKYSDATKCGTRSATSSPPINGTETSSSSPANRDQIGVFGICS
jgi:hypothetical protein